MEIAVKRIVALSVALGVFGAASQLQPKYVKSSRSEAWVQDALPTQFGKFRMIPSREDPKVSYKATPFEYEALKPFGLVGRVFFDGKLQYDSMAVVGNRRDTFHDPGFCLSGSYLTVSESKVINISTRTHGLVPMSVMTAQDKQGKQIVAYVYLGPNGFRPTQNQLYLDWFWSELRLGPPKIGAFYRFMTTTSDADEKSLLAFARDYLDAASETSKGEL